MESTPLHEKHSLGFASSCSLVASRRITGHSPVHHCPAHQCLQDRGFTDLCGFRVHRVHIFVGSYASRFSREAVTGFHVLYFTNPGSKLYKRRETSSGTQAGPHATHTHTRTHKDKQARPNKWGEAIRSIPAAAAATTELRAGIHIVFLRQLRQFCTLPDYMGKGCFKSCEPWLHLFAGFDLRGTSREDIMRLLTSCCGTLGRALCTSSLCFHADKGHTQQH